MLENIEFKIYQQKKYGEMMEVVLKNGGDFAGFLLGNKVVSKEEFEEYYEEVCVTTCKFKCKAGVSKKEKIHNILEKIFHHFNINEAAQDKNRIKYSLSVLDIIEINNKKYQVMGFGYEKLSF